MTSRSRAATDREGAGPSLPPGLPPGTLVRVTVPPSRPTARLRRDGAGALCVSPWRRPHPEDALASVVAWLAEVGLVVRRVGRQGARLRVDAVASPEAAGDEP